MNYTETVDWMFSQLPMYQRQGKTAFKKDLSNTLALSKHLNFPEKKFKSVHVAGTNGKGSTSHMLASVLQEAGYKVGLYTSPHLKDFRERIKINGNVILESDVVNFISDNKAFLEKNKLSFFEMTVGLAFDCFAKQQVDIAIVEVGLGGRLDSTNIITPEVSVITNIGLDHTQFLGETLPEIAFEKAGIIKQNVPIVVSEFQNEVISVFKDIAEEKKAKLNIASKNIESSFKTDLLGLYQHKNVKAAVLTIELLNEKGFNVSKENLKNGLLNVVKNTQLLGRWQILQQSPKVICDTGHNKEGLLYIMQQLNEESYNNLHIVLGVVNDKDLGSVLPLFPKNGTYYFCKPNIPRGLDATILQKESLKFKLIGDCYNSVNEAFESAKKNSLENDLIFIGGSTFVVAEVI
ncbi:dihydrofolate synthase / folylpolyglutamate synthase [Lutibacter oricola]|uniref:Dihydrofolate synthase/folylpolyglutamate synthase n=1 Tax=Lutibacter oricola TaxID=762486 RepID=A0A1H3GJA5_9FLAO|nr:folylpolyglutamate synthase/dihydrofolate synthase family protein [Lutibacter oricola]SDY03085.1 dihydrofolate synthase / folylpolyglutamate synthase [Lutibacter oricola]